MFVILGIGILVSALWTRVPAVAQIVHAALDPTAGRLLDWNVNLGMIIIVGIITLIITLVQKLTIDAATLKRLKAEQKDIQQKMKEYQNDPTKFMEMQKKQMTLMKEIMEVSMGSTLYSAVPIILFFRWFSAYFSTVDVKIFGFMSWFWAYLVISIILSSIFRKIFKLP